jgi:16S rRNA (guanine527-N7)-methyltransferase
MTISSSKPPSGQTIQNACREFGLAANSEQVLKIQQYIKILLIWNDQLNLTAIRDPLDILYRHFCESMYATVAVPVEKGRLADVGSGAGFPGLPMKIMCPDLHVFLVESNVKKATFLAEVVRELGLTDARVLVSRYEELGEEVAPLDFVCSRAVGQFGALLDWAGSKRVAAKKVVLWTGTRDLDEIRRITTWDWREPILVPYSLRRLLLVGTKNA